MSSYPYLIKARKLRRASDYGACVRLLWPIFNSSVAAGNIDPDIVRSLAEAFNLSGRFDEGKQVFLTSLESDPGNTRLVGRYGEYLSSSGYVKKGLDFVDAALQVIPSCQHLALSKTIILHRYMNDLDSAATFAQNFINTYVSTQVDVDLSNELSSIFHKIEKRPDFLPSKDNNIWGTLGARRAISAQTSISTGYSGLTRK